MMTTQSTTLPGNAVLSEFKPSAVIVQSSSLDNMNDAAEKIRRGGLVGFPTETVYGLGANAFDCDAVLSIFTAKGRPLTDPVIVHVVDAEFAKTLLTLSTRQQRLFDLLAKRFWPGPLTIVAKSSPKIPMIVTAQTGYVGVRHPQHDVAQQLIALAGVPIAAPSANRFGHVSPTSAIHVFDDLGHSPITILDVDSTNACKIGIESTVLKLVDDNSLVILRKGGVSERALQECLANSEFSDISLTAVIKTVAATTSEGQEAPGQLLTHYAPDIQAYILKDIITTNDNNNTITSSPITNSHPLSESYRDLSENSQVLEAANVLFSTLRWSESVDGAKIILLPDLRSERVKSLDHSDAVFDRIFRAASGKTASLDIVNQRVIINQ
eukprot:gene12487-14656_t